jgi:hypothetical protein
MLHVLGSVLAEDVGIFLSETNILSITVFPSLGKGGRSLSLVTYLIQHRGMEY